MHRVPVSAWVEENSQTKLARLMGVTQASISKMIRTKRNVFVVTDDEGQISLVEEKKLTSKPN